MNKEDLIQVAKDNTKIVEDGFYELPSGEKVSLSDDLDTAIESTWMYTPDELHGLMQKKYTTSGGISEHPPKIEVIEGKSGEVSRQVALQDETTPMLLNFASAKHAGGGYIRGTTAQEEDICRCSALYYTQGTYDESLNKFYTVNKHCGSVLYTDHMMFSYAVPFFRDEAYNLLEKPVNVSIITAPAPNAREFRRRVPTGGDHIVNETIDRRIGMVLALAEEHECRTLVLGAFGCGVFGNDTLEVAKMFNMWLHHPRFSKSFDRAVFAIYVKEDQRDILDTFRDVLTPSDEEE